MVCSRSTLGAVAVSFLCVFAVAGCEGSSSSGEQVSQVVTEAGGEVVAPGGEARLVFPPGALTQAEEVTVEVITGSSIQNLVTDVFDLSPSGITFAVPVTLVVKVGGNVDGEPYLAKVVNGTPVKVSGSTFNSATGELSGALQSFSQYGGFVTPEPTQTDLEKCQECASSNCGAQVQACEDDSACEKLLDCIDSCVASRAEAGDCVDSCQLLHPGGATKFQAMATCAEDKCPVCSGGGEQLTDQELCRACIDDSCPSQHQACKNLPSCNAILTCMESCSGAKMQECASDCIDSNPAGSALIDALGDCIDTHCTICSEVAEPKEEPWEDPDTGLIWQNPSAPEPMDWMDAITYCNGLHIDGHMDMQRRWRLPKLKELRTLIQGCPATETGGSCNVDDDGCKGGLNSNCIDESCKGCTPAYEDDKPVCMWPDALVGPCGDAMSRGVYWSILAVDVPGSRMHPAKWTVDFGHGEVSTWPSLGDGSTKFWVRCVR